MANEDPLDPRTSGNGPAPAPAGFVALPGGMDAGTAPSILPDTKYAFGVNVSSRGGLLKTRQMLQRYPVHIPAGKFQGACLYRRAAGDRIIFCVEGVVYSLNLTTYKRMILGTFPTTSFDRAYFCQADRYMIVQNGITYPTENWPFILDGDYLVDNADVQIFTDNGWQYLGDQDHYEAKRVPIGTVMAFGHGRLFVTVPRVWDTGKISGTEQWLPVTGERVFVAGDIFQSDNPSEFLAFTETNYLAEGGAITAPAFLGQIRAMSLFRNAATGTGLGALVILGSEGVAAYSINAARAQWLEIDLAQMLFMDAGMESPAGLVPVNDDLAFRSSDGIRFVRYSQSQSAGGSGSMANTPQSFEVSPVIALDSRQEIPSVSMAFVENRLYTTSAGSVSDLGDIIFGALIVLDTASVGSVTELKPTPEYDGIYTGLNFLHVLRARYAEVDRAFVFARVEDRNELWFFLAASEALYLDGGSSATECQLVTKQYNFGTPLLSKEFKYGEIWLSNARGACELELYWRADKYELWNACMPYRFDAASSGLTQNRYQLRLPPAEVATYDTVSGRDVRAGFTFQFCLRWKGNLTIDTVTFQAQVAGQGVPDISCETATAIPLLEGTSGELLDMYEYQIPALTPLPVYPSYQCYTLSREPQFFWEFDSLTDTLNGYITVVGPVPAGTVITFPGSGVSVTPLGMRQNSEDAPPGITSTSVVSDLSRFGGLTSGGGSGGGSVTLPYIPPGGSLTLGAGVTPGTTGIQAQVNGGPPIDVKPPDPQPPVDDNKNPLIPRDPQPPTPPGLPNPTPQPGRPQAGIIMSFEVSPTTFDLTPGDTGYGTVTLYNYTAYAVSVNVSLDSTPSNGDGTFTYEFSGTNADGSFATGTLEELLTGDYPPSTGRTVSFEVTASGGDWGDPGVKYQQRDAYRVQGAPTSDQPGDTQPVYDQTRTIIPSVTAGVPVISLTGAPSFVYLQTDTVAPSAQDITLSNVGDPGSVLSWTRSVTPDDAEIIVSGASSGTLAVGESVVFQVTVPLGKDPDEYISSLVISGGPGVEQETTDVTLRVVPEFTGALLFTCYGVYTNQNPPGPLNPSGVTGDGTSTVAAARDNPTQSWTSSAMAPLGTLSVVGKVSVANGANSFMINVNGTGFVESLGPTAAKITLDSITGAPSFPQPSEEQVYVEHRPDVPSWQQFIKGYVSFAPQP